jgi:hypothetical protein
VRESCASYPSGPMEFSMGSRRLECHVTFAGERASERKEKKSHAQIPIQRQFQV